MKRQQNFSTSKNSSNLFPLITKASQKKNKIYAFFPSRGLIVSINDIEQQGISNKWRRAFRHDWENTHSTNRVTRDASGPQRWSRYRGRFEWRSRENRDRSDRPPRKRSPPRPGDRRGSWWTRPREFLAPSASRVREESEATDVAAMIFRGGKRDIRASVLISMERRDAGPPTTSQRTPAFVESGLWETVCVCVPPLSAPLLEINCVPRYEESYFRNVDFPCRVIDG